MENEKVRRLEAEGKMSNVKAQMTNEIQMSKFKFQMRLVN